MIHVDSQGLHDRHSGFNRDLAVEGAVGHDSCRLRVACCG